MFSKFMDLIRFYNDSSHNLAAEEMDRHDEALRETIKKLWPISGKKMVSLLVPPNEGESFCVQSHSLAERSLP